MRYYRSFNYIFNHVDNSSTAQHSLADIDQAFNLCADFWHNFTQDKKYNALGRDSNSCSVGSSWEWRPWRISRQALKFSVTFPETIYSWVWAIFVQFKPSKHLFSTLSLKDPTLGVWRISNFKDSDFWAHCASACCYCPFPEMYFIVQMQCTYVVWIT